MTERRTRQMAAGDQWLARAAGTLARAEPVTEKLYDRGLWLVDMRFRAPTEDSAEWFVVVRAGTDNGPVVGFSSGPTFLDAVKTVWERLDNDTMKWREDVPYGERTD